MPLHIKNLLAKKTNFIQAYLGAVLWAAFIMLLCGLPGQDLPNIDFWKIDIEDKLAHVGVFAILGIFMVYGFKRRNPSFKITFRYTFFLILIATSYGALTEILQGLLFPSRFASFSDLIADFIGSVLGIVVAKYFFINQS